MAKKKNLPPLVYDPNVKKLNEFFYTRYDENFLFNKAVTLSNIVNNEPRFKLQMAEDQSINPNRINDKFFESLRAEIHFTEMHQFEGFFALLLAIFQNLPHWIYLTTYATGEIKEAVNLFIKGDAEALQQLTGGKVSTYSQFVSEAVYTGTRPPDGLMKDNWNTNLENAVWLIKRMAERYADGLAEYNAYKHGLRVMTGESLIDIGMPIQDGISNGTFLHKASKDSLRYLVIEDEVLQLLRNVATNETAPFIRAKEKKQKEGVITHSIFDHIKVEVVEEEDVRRPYIVTKHFNPKESMSYIREMNRILLTIKNIRLVIITGQKKVERMETFFNLDKEQVELLGAENYEFRISY